MGPGRKKLPQQAMIRFIEGLRTHLLLSQLLLLALPAATLASEIDRPVEALVDRHVDDLLRERGVTPAPAAPDDVLVRRTTLDLVGRIPTPDEVRAFRESSDPDRRRALVDRLLESPDFILHQAREFDRLLRGGTSSDLTEYFRHALERGRSWDQIFTELMRGTSSDPETPDPARYLRDRIRDLDRLTNAVSVDFFGINVSCAQCHDHPLVPTWTQDHYFGMKSFFVRTFENGGFIGERSHGQISFKNTEGVEKRASLLFLTGETVEEPPEVVPDAKERQLQKKLLEKLKKEKQPPPPPEFSRREQLIRLGLDSSRTPYLSRSLVNRVWARFLGRGLVEPLDQMHAANPPSHPALLDELARDFRDHGHDLRRLVRGLVLSEAYARSSTWNQEGEPPEPPAPELFAVGIVRPLTPHQFAYSLRVASTNPEILASSLPAPQLEKRLRSLEESSRKLVPSLSPAGENFQVNVDEALYLSNSPEVHASLIDSSSGDSLTGHLGQLRDPGELVNTAVWNIFNRPPSDEEIELLTGFLTDCSKAEEGSSPACEQLVWALLTSTEFRFNH